MIDRVVRVDAGNFVAGVCFGVGGEAVWSAPILYWVIKRGWKFEQFVNYANNRGWDVHIMDDPPDTSAS